MTQRRGRFYSQDTSDARRFVTMLQDGESLPVHAMTPAAREALLAVENTAHQKNDKDLLSFLETERQRLEWGSEWGPYQKPDTSPSTALAHEDEPHNWFRIFLIATSATLCVLAVLIISHFMPEREPVLWHKNNVWDKTPLRREVPESGVFRCELPEAFEVCHRDALALNLPVLLSEGVWRFRKDTVSHVPVIVLPGTTIAISSGTTLTLPVCPVAGDYQIFQGLGTIDILDCADIKPVWFGASPLTVRGNLLRVPR